MLTASLFFALTIIAYLLGCLNASFYLARWAAKVDIREFGSGNAGSRNLLRSLGRGYAISAFVWDAAKAFFAVYGAIRLYHPMAPMALSYLPLVCLCAVVAGHIWPIQLGWRGGKGLACLIGGLGAFDPLLLGFCLLLCLVIIIICWLGFAWRQFDAAVYLSVLLVPLVFPIYRIVYAHSSFQELLIEDFLLMGVSAIVLYAHRKNIRDLYAGSDVIQSVGTEK
ncbi:glycerol-3-phosphate acyltransferase [Undibacterium sp. Ji22W]|uniref:glycerol-3-phosphate acyltransferase n=1 Tax=Undibacterium sp. Ji22W TaxID=3413038 RepID=UPI003BF36269